MPLTGTKTTELSILINGNRLTRIHCGYNEPQEHIKERGRLMGPKGIRGIKPSNETSLTSSVDGLPHHGHGGSAATSADLRDRMDDHDSKTSIPSSSVTIIPTSAVNNDHTDPVSLLRAFHHELDHPNKTMGNNQRDEFLRLIEKNNYYRTIVAVSIIDPSVLDNLEAVDTSTGIIRNPNILSKIEKGGNDFQRVLDGTELLLRLLTETTNGVGVFRFEDHPSALALIGYLYWFAGATGPAVAFSSMSEFSRNRIIQSEDNPVGGSNRVRSRGQGPSIKKPHSEIINDDDLVDASPRSHGKANHGDLLPRFTVMLVRNLAAPSHKNSIEANLDPLDGGSFLK